MKKIYLFVSVFVFFSVSISDSYGNIVLNGGFETGNFASWIVSDPTYGTFVSGASGPYIPHSGDYFASLGATGLLGTVSQTLNTVAGTTYTLDYFLASDGITPNEFRVDWGGMTLFDHVNIPAQGYVEYTFQVKATSASTKLTFYERNDNGYFSLDDVSVNPVTVPEPTSMIPVGIGMVTLAGYSVYRGKRDQNRSYAN